MSKRTVYVVGFACADDGVVLIRKNRPEWQAGLWNGVGGHVEVGEFPDAAMVREFREETGVSIESWDLMVRMLFPAAIIYFYRAQVSRLVLEGVRSVTDEPVAFVQWAQVDKQMCIPNLSWLVPLAMHRADAYGPMDCVAEVAQTVTPVEAGESE